MNCSSGDGLCHLSVCKAQQLSWSSIATSAEKPAFRVLLLNFYGIRCLLELRWLLRRSGGPLFIGATLVAAVEMRC